MVSGFAPWNYPHWFVESPAYDWCFPAPATLVRAPSPSFLAPAFQIALGASPSPPVLVLHTQGNRREGIGEPFFNADFQEKPRFVDSAFTLVAKGRRAVFRVAEKKIFVGALEKEGQNPLLGVIFRPA